MTVCPQHPTGVGPGSYPRGMTIQRTDNVGIVDDLDAAVASFTGLGMESDVVGAAPAGRKSDW